MTDTLAPALHLTPEQTELRALVRKALGDGDVEPSRVTQLLATAIGAWGLALPERYGGVDCALAEVAVVTGELGRALSPVPYLAGQLAARAVLHTGDTDAHARLLPGLAQGRTAALAWAEAGSWEPEAVALEAVPGPDGSDWLLTGGKEHVLGADGELLLAFARTGAGLALFELLEAPHIELPPALDPSRPLGRCTFAATRARLLGTPGAPAARVLARTRDEACALLAAEQVGGAEQCVELTVEYARTRVQFGRPIGSFQAVKHRLADMYARLESARSAARAAAVHPERYGALAKSVCGEAYEWIAGETIQLHGGIGFTWEHPAHRYFKRAHATGQLLGPPARHRARLLADRLAALDTPGLR
ncbi:acyl-CoA dehydrogenase family protein [Streptomyces albus]|uniref:acyl-CoA dehydrogenase family protein n=1 Tax=Streptomyces albus TaxID=1888 RepID=UPI0006E19A66|nr:acyl-CoA dehydrogenase family protein [Streptomyces albus]